jgi:hypothetical protein
VAIEAEAGLLEHVLEWARLHQIDDPTDPSGGPVATYGDTPVALAGEGAPQVAQFAVLEFGATVGMSRRATEALFAEVLELGHRLPRTWARVQDRSLKAWRARQIAAATVDLSGPAALFVDAQVAPFANRISARELQRLIDSAIARFMPAFAEERAAAAEESQFVRIDADRLSYSGTCQLAGELDLADAQDLEQALRAGAAQQKDLGSPLSLDARRAKALGNLARGEIVLDYNSGLPEQASTDPITPPTVAPRQVVLYAHLGTDGTTFLENAGGHLVTPDQVREWCRTAGTVTVRPVIDLNDEIASLGYRPSDRQREQVILRDRWCPFPFCERDARHGDQDHIEPYDPDGPPWQTTSSNLAPPCRTHHRVKTFTDWTYTRLGPATYLWRSPHGYVFLKDTTGTQDLTPRPVDPPGHPVLMPPTSETNRSPRRS